MSKYTFENINTIYSGDNTVIPFSGERKRIDKIDMHCPKHGIFQQAISSIISGKGCQKCYFDKMKGRIKYTTEEWIELAKNIHNNFYDYSQVLYKGINHKIDIICPVHGVFSQAANVHLSGHGCRKCSTDKMVNLRSYNTEKYVEAAILKHGNKYSYLKTIFADIRSPVIITCPTHGDFLQIAYYHTAGNGCQQCGIEKTTYKSKPEYDIIDFLKELGITNIIHSSRLLGFEIDIFLPDHNIAIEYNGLYWHSSNSIIDDKCKSKYHLEKTQKCEENGIKLFHIFENEWLDQIKQKIWKSMLANAINKSKRIYARLCKLEEIHNYLEICPQFETNNNAEHSFGDLFSSSDPIYLNKKSVLDTDSTEK